MFNLTPYRGEGNLFRMFDDFEKNFWSNSISDVRQFRTDIVDKGDHFELRADLPGFDREDIQINTDSGHLTIAATKDDSKEEKKENYIRRERRIGSFSRSFDLAGINADNIRASYKHGVLKLYLPKQEKQLPQSKQIPIN